MSPVAVAQTASGYGHPLYARALAELGAPLHLPRSGGWLLTRAIPGASAHDAMGPYPLFTCERWPDLGADLEALTEELVSVTLVADPLGDYTPEQLRSAFDLVRPFKDHYLIDLSRPLSEHVAAHHMRNARRARQSVRVEHCADPAQASTAWIALYANLVRRHGITGWAAFSEQSLAAQLQVPGAQVFHATVDGESVGMGIWYLAGDRAYYHLAAYSDLGYQVKASYALFWHALGWLREHARWVNLGGAAGMTDASDSGLARFKRGWATETRTAYLCGRILDQKRYAALSAGQPSGFFPAYRQGASA